MDENIKREQFYKEAAEFFEAGLIHEVYNTERFSICNIANQNYAIFFYPRTEKSAAFSQEHGHFGFFLSASIVKKIVRNKKYIADVPFADRSFFAQYGFQLNEKAFAIAKKYKEANDLKGPGADVDLQWEAKLRSKGYTPYIPQGESADSPSVPEDQKQSPKPGAETIQQPVKKKGFFSKLLVRQ